MWLKFLLAIVIVAVATAYAFNERYLNELNYARKPLGSFLKEYEYGGDFDKSLKTLIESRSAKVNFAYLTQEEQAACADYFAMLGKGDSYSQKSFFSAKKAGLEEKRAASEGEAKSRCALYIKLGVLAGLAAVILIV